MRKLNVLFLCTGNSARSQMAEALLRDMAGERFDAYSAGTDPKGVNPWTIRALEEAGISTEGLRSKGVKEFLGKLPIQYLIIVCGNAESSCPTIWPGVVERMFWPFDDPAAATGSDHEKLAEFCRVRDEIAAKLHAWLAELD